MMKETFLNVNETARALGERPSEVLRRIEDGELWAVRLHRGGKLFVPVTEVNEALRAAARPKAKAA
jgi:hypothetical protein